MSVTTLEGRRLFFESPIVIGGLECPATGIGEVGEELSSDVRLVEQGVKVVLTGSSANETNVTTSDIDLLAVFPEPLGVADAQRWQLWLRARQLVETVLAEKYGSHRVTPTNKCLNMDDIDGISIDIMPVLQKTVVDKRDGTPIEAIEFWTLFDEGSHIVNFPWLHLANGRQKQLETDGMYKQLVRAMKIMRNIFVGDRLISPESAFSYHLECLAYNVPNEQFAGSLVEIMRNTIEMGKLALVTGTNLPTVSGMHKVFGSTVLNWKPENALRLFDTYEQMMS